MRFIDKTEAGNRVKGLAINRNILESCWDGHCYVNLHYDTVDKTELIGHLVDEQDGFCCYCMRRLHISAESNHNKNVSLEHIIPHNISAEDWVKDKAEYRRYPILTKNTVVCPKGVVENPYKKLGMPPFPHFLAYDNLVASCDGQTLDEYARVMSHHCCNIKRGCNFVEPLFFHENVESEITYDNRGNLQCPEEYVPYLDKRGVNVMCNFLNMVRQFWKRIADSEYTVAQVYEAENNDSLRKDIIDDVFTYDYTGHWLFLTEQSKWCIYSDYAWFYGYYKSRQRRVGTKEH